MYIKLKELRQKNQISIKELSNKSGVSYSEILSSEDNLVNPLVSSILKLSVALDVKLDEDLLKGEYIKKLRKEIEFKKIRETFRS